MWITWSWQVGTTLPLLCTLLTSRSVRYAGTDEAVRTACIGRWEVDRQVVAFKYDIERSSSIYQELCFEQKICRTRDNHWKQANSNQCVLQCEVLEPVIMLESILRLFLRVGTNLKCLLTCKTRKIKDVMDVADAAWCDINAEVNQYFMSPWGRGKGG